MGEWVGIDVLTAAEVPIDVEAMVGVADSEVASPRRVFDSDELKGEGSSRLDQTKSCAD